MRIVVLFTLFISSIMAATPSVKKTSVRYKKGGRIDFESLLIEGESKKPEMSVVTGNIGEKDTGLLKFRKDFTDMMARDFGEKIR
jgi:hypothetical protein